MRKNFKNIKTNVKIRCFFFLSSLSFKTSYTSLEKYQPTFEDRLVKIKTPVLYAF